MVNKIIIFFILCAALLAAYSLGINNGTVNTYTVAPHPKPNKQECIVELQFKNGDVHIWHGTYKS